jgi:hypothetical protein
LPELLILPGKSAKKTFFPNLRKEGLRVLSARETALILFHPEPFLASQDQT